MPDGQIAPNLGQTPTSHSGINISASKVNTLAIVASFVGTIFIGGAAYNNLKVGIESSVGFQVETKERMARLDTDRATGRQELDKRISIILDSINAQKSVVDGMLYQIGQLQKADESNIARVDRMGDYNNGKFTEMNEKINTMTTQQALTNQTLSEIKNIMGGWRGLNRNDDVTQTEPRGRKQ